MTKRRLELEIDIEYTTKYEYKTKKYLEPYLKVEVQKFCGLKDFHVFDEILTEVLDPMPKEVLVKEDLRGTNWAYEGAFQHTFLPVKKYLNARRKVYIEIVNKFLDLQYESVNRNFDGKNEMPSSDFRVDIPKVADDLVLYDDDQDAEKFIEAYVEVHCKW